MWCEFDYLEMMIITIVYMEASRTSIAVLLLLYWLVFIRLFVGLLKSTGLLFWVNRFILRIHADSSQHLLQIALNKSIGPAHSTGKGRPLGCTALGLGPAIKQDRRNQQLDTWWHVLQSCSERERLWISMCVTASGLQLYLLHILHIYISIYIDLYMS